MEQLATLAEFKSEVELWRSKGFEEIITTRFEGKDMILLVPDYVYPDRSFYIAIPYDSQTILCMD